MLKVKDLMTKEVFTVPPDMSVKEAARLLFEKEISGLPVANQENKIIGMITEKDLIAMALPNYLEKLGDFDFILDEEPFIKKIADADKVRVKDIMRKEVLCVDEDTPLPEVARLMIINKVRRIPVLDKSKNLVGIIARADIVKEIARKTGII